MTEVQLSVSPEAKAHILQIMKRYQQAKGLRLKIKRSGCSGFMYAPEVVEEVPAADAVIVIDSELTIFVPQEDITLVAGTCVNLLEKDLNQRQLVFQHPRAVNTCGCGESFSLQEKDDVSEKGEADEA